MYHVIISSCFLLNRCRLSSVVPPRKLFHTFLRRLRCLKNLINLRSSVRRFANHILQTFCMRTMSYKNSFRIFEVLHSLTSSYTPDNPLTTQEMHIMHAMHFQSLERLVATSLFPRLFPFKFIVLPTPTALNANGSIFPSHCILLFGNNNRSRSLFTTVTFERSLNSYSSILLSLYNLETILKISPLASLRFFFNSSKI